MAKLAINGGAPVRKKPWPVGYPLFSETVEEEIKAATRVIRSRRLCSQFGSEVESFERAYAEYIGVKHAVAVSTGTAALHVALAVLDIAPGDEVILPAYTFQATASAVAMQNATPVFADSEPKVQGIDPEHAGKLVTKRTKAIIPVAANGYPLDMDRLMDFAREAALAVIEDASHAHGAEYKGRKIGSIGRLNAFSFQQQKNLPLGEGGILTTDDDELADRAREMRSFGRGVGYNYRMAELHAAIGAVRLADLDRQTAVRIANADYLHEKLAGLRGITTQKPLPETRCVYYNFVLRYEPQMLGVGRDRFREALKAEGVGFGGFYYPLYRHPAFQDAEGSCPVAEDYCDNRNINIKVHAAVTHSDLDDAAAALEKVIENIDELR